MQGVKLRDEIRAAGTICISFFSFCHCLECRTITFLPTAYVVREEVIFSVCLSVHIWGGGGTPSQVQVGLYPISGPGRGYPIQLMVGGVYPIQLMVGGTLAGGPCPGYPPHPGLGGGPTQGTPHPGLGGGLPRVPPHPGLGGGHTRGTLPSRSRWGAHPGVFPIQG